MNGESLIKDTPCIIQQTGYENIQTHQANVIFFGETRVMFTKSVVDQFIFNKAPYDHICS